MKKRELERSIIRMIRNNEMYGYEIRKLLAGHGENVQLSYVYKTLKEMSEEGLLDSHLRKGEHGPQRRQYLLTELGKKELGKIFGEATELIHDFYEEYVSKLPPEFFTERFQTMVRELIAGRETVALVISEPLTFLHRELLDGISMRSGAKQTYLIKPSFVSADVELPNLTILDGAFDDLPLKDKSLDAAVVVDIQDATNLGICCRELRRVMKVGGSLLGCAPFMGLSGAYDPLEVGEFMKRMKYSSAGKPYLDKEAIKDALGKVFDYVDVASMGYMTGFVSGLKPSRKP